jgi:hypothetical protein
MCLYGEKMAIVSLTMGKFIAGIIVAILASSAISVGASTMLMVGPQGPEGRKAKLDLRGQLATLQDT